MAFSSNFGGTTQSNRSASSWSNYMTGTRPGRQMPSPQFLNPNGSINYQDQTVSLFPTDDRVQINNPYYKGPKDLTQRNWDSTLGDQGASNLGYDGYANIGNAPTIVGSTSTNIPIVGPALGPQHGAGTGIVTDPGADNSGETPYTGPAITPPAITPPPDPNEFELDIPTFTGGGGTTGGGARGTPTGGGNPVGTIDWGAYGGGTYGTANPNGSGNNFSFTPYTSPADTPAPAPLGTPQGGGWNRGGGFGTTMTGGGAGGSGRNARTNSDDDTQTFSGMISDAFGDFTDAVGGWASGFTDTLSGLGTALTTPAENPGWTNNSSESDRPPGGFGGFGGPFPGGQVSIPSNIYDPVMVGNRPAPFTMNDMELLYQEVFGKSADQPGIEWWANNAVRNGMSLQDIKDAIRAEGAALGATGGQPQGYTINGQSAGFTQDQMNSLYQELFQRDADVNGLNWWAQTAIDNGMSWQDVEAAIRADAARQGSAPPADQTPLSSFNGNYLDFKEQIDSIYREVFGRRLDDAGAQAYWNNGNPMSMDAIQRDMMLSGERSGLDQDWNDTTNSTQRAIDAILQEVSGLGVGDAADAGRINTLIDDLLADIGGYNNPVYGGLPDSFSTTLRGAADTLDGIIAQSEAAGSDVTAYEQGIISQARDLRDRLQALDPWDKAGAEALRNEYDTLVENASLYQSPVDFDFTDELSAISPLRGSINQFLTNWNSMNENRLDDLADLGSTISGGSFYDLGQINSWENQLNELARGDDVSSYMDMLNGLRGQHTSALNDIRTYLDETAGGIADIPLYDLGAFTRRGNMLNDIAVDLNRFKGSDASALQDDLRAYMRNLSGRLDERGSYVTGIENSAESALRSAKAGAYKRLEDLQALRDQYNSIGSEVDLYDVMSAEDELMELLNFIQSEETRIREDLKTSEMYDRQGGVVNGGSFLGDLGFAGGGYLTDDQIIALLSARDAEQNGPRRGGNPSPFSSSLGVIRV